MEVYQSHIKPSLVYYCVLKQAPTKTKDVYVPDIIRMNLSRAGGKVFPIKGPFQ